MILKDWETFKRECEKGGIKPTGRYDARDAYIFVGEKYLPQGDPQCPETCIRGVVAVTRGKKVTPMIRYFRFGEMGTEEHRKKEMIEAGKAFVADLGKAGFYAEKG